VSDKIQEFLGDVDQDLVDFVLENIREKKRPDDVVDGLEPVCPHSDVVLYPG